jgi:hypothetical protein
MGDKPLKVSIKEILETKKKGKKSKANRGG